MIGNEGYLQPSCVHPSHFKPLLLLGKPPLGDGQATPLVRRVFLQKLHHPEAVHRDRCQKDRRDQDNSALKAALIKAGSCHPAVTLSYATQPQHASDAVQTIVDRVGSTSTVHRVVCRMQEVRAHCF
jgi:hypothetical protein